MVEVKRFSIGEVAARAGVATLALRLYEETVDPRPTGPTPTTAAITPTCCAGELHRVAQKVGLTLAEIKSALELLPERRL